MTERSAARCAECGGPLPPPAGRGRPATYCSAACRARAWRARRDVDRLVAEQNAAFGEATVPLPVVPDSPGLADELNSYFAKPKEEP